MLVSTLLWLLFPLNGSQIFSCPADWLAGCPRTEQIHAHRHKQWLTPADKHFRWVLQSLVTPADSYQGDLIQVNYITQTWSQADVFCSARAWVISSAGSPRCPNPDGESASRCCVITECVIRLHALAHTHRKIPLKILWHAKRRLLWLN